MSNQHYSDRSGRHNLIELSPNVKAARASEIMSSQRETIRQQEDLIQVLKGILAAAGQPKLAVTPTCMRLLTPQERALVGLLYAHYPSPMQMAVILECLPGYDHVEDRQLQVVTAVVHRVRKKLGAAAIQTEHGIGYSLGREFYENLGRVPPRGVAAAG